MSSPCAWFLVHPHGLVLRCDGDAVELPTDDDVKALGADVDGAHAIGTYEGAEAMAAAVPKDAEVKD